MKTIGLLIILTVFNACDIDRQYEDYALTKEGDLTLAAQNHPHGFGQTQCFHCHVKANIHQVNRINSPVFDIAKDLVEDRGLNSCSVCHGDNGAP